jgi:hypothetical protein
MYVIPLHSLGRVEKNCPEGRLEPAPVSASGAGEGVPLQQVPVQAAQDRDRQRA